VRLKRNHTCLVCRNDASRQSKARRRAQRNASRPTLAVVPRPAPVLPAYLAETSYLSSDKCDEWTHRYRQSAWTLRYKDTDQCVQCVTQHALSRAQERRA
jgi:hypothetical protein